MCSIQFFRVSVGGIALGAFALCRGGNRQWGSTVGAMRIIAHSYPWRKKT